MSIPIISMFYLRQRNAYGDPSHWVEIALYKLLNGRDTAPRVDSY